MIIIEINKNEERIFAFVFISLLPLAEKFAGVAARPNETKWNVTSSEQCFPPGEISIDRNPSRPDKAPITIAVRPVPALIDFVSNYLYGLTNNGNFRLIK